jgi:hypothetical protein
MGRLLHVVPLFRNIAQGLDDRPRFLTPSSERSCHQPKVNECCYAESCWPECIFSAPAVTYPSQGEQMRTFDHSFWPSHVATAWVATRDRDFVGQVPFDRSMRYLSVALANYRANNRGFRFPHKRSHEAFLALLDATAEGGLQAIGNPYRWLAGRPPRIVCERTRVIDPLEIVSAVCRDDHGSPDCLVPKTMKPHGCRFQDVLFRRGDVLARFPALQATLATARNEDEAIKVLSSYVTDMIKRSDAKTWLHDQGFNLGPRVFQRVWRSARERAGLTPAAPRGRKRQA